VAAFNAGDVDRLQALCTDDVEIAGLRSAVEDTRYAGPGTVFWRDAQEVWEEMRMDIEEVQVEGETVTVRGKWRGRGRSSGVEVEREIVNDLRLREGRIASASTRADPQGAA
jgi:ketosteroid isomerase-like protein